MLLDESSRDLLAQLSAFCGSSVCHINEFARVAQSRK